MDCVVCISRTRGQPQTQSRSCRALTNTQDWLVLIFRYITERALDFSIKLLAPLSWPNCFKCSELRCSKAPSWYRPLAVNFLHRLCRLSANSITQCKTQNLQIIGQQAGEVQYAAHAELVANMGQVFARFVLFDHVSLRKKRLELILHTI